MTVDVAERLYSVSQLAALWGVSKQYVYEEITEGRLSKLNLGNGDRDKIRVAASEVARWVDAHRVAS